jgi:hypothetical protein
MAVIGSSEANSSTDARFARDGLGMAFPWRFGVREECTEMARRAKRRN